VLLVLVPGTGVSAATGNHKEMARKTPVCKDLRNKIAETQAKSRRSGVQGTIKIPFILIPVFLSFPVLCVCVCVCCTLFFKH